jgi:hypothetical protein
MELLIQNPSDLYQTEVSYFYIVKKTYEGRLDGGPTMRSKTAKLISPNITKYEIAQEKTIKRPGEEIIECHRLINFINSQKITSPEIEIKKLQKSRGNCGKKLDGK